LHLVAMPGGIAPISAAGDALKKLIVEHRCLAGEAYGRTICNVVYEGADRTSCQFTFACDGALGHPKIPEDWRAVQVLAARLLAGEGSGPDNTDGATYFHTAAVHPSWAPKMDRVTQIGNHIFYRAKAAAISVAFRGPLQ
jgi:spore germination cell wall hydrolase CwlJ-like protein